MKKNILIILAVIIVAVGGWYFSTHPAPQAPSNNGTADNGGSTAEQPIATAHYQCDGGKTIDAAFYKGGPAPEVKPGEPPVPTGSAKVSLSDGRTMTLHQTLSADGARYSDGDPMKQGDESFVFWSKGNGALVLENNKEKSYIGCVMVKPDPGDLPQVYESGSNGFSVRYPKGYTADPSYKYQEMGPGKDIYGVSLTIPASMAEGTNLGSDTRVSVEEIPNAKECTAGLFLDHGAMPLNVTTTTEDGTEYSTASFTGAGAGNRYEETVYALPGTNPCVAVRYWIHYGVIENYPQGAVKEFDKNALLKQFDAIRRTLTINQ